MRLATAKSPVKRTFRGVSGVKALRLCNHALVQGAVRHGGKKRHAKQIDILTAFSDSVSSTAIGMSFVYEARAPSRRDKEHHEVRNRKKPRKTCFSRGLSPPTGSVPT